MIMHITTFKDKLNKKIKKNKYINKEELKMFKYLKQKNDNNDKYLTEKERLVLALM
tara:strand:+ start:305 stop:472 length:168 start_codon:yes stop_codon:yes gene_type:complete